jgi:hypothetical protein
VEHRRLTLVQGSQPGGDRHRAVDGCQGGILQRRQQAQEGVLAGDPGTGGHEGNARSIVLEPDTAAREGRNEGSEGPRRHEAPGDRCPGTPECKS